MCCQQPGPHSHCLGMASNKRYVFSNSLEAASPKSVSLAKDVGRAILPPEVLGESIFLASSSFSGGCRHSLADGHTTPAPASVTPLPPSLLLSVVKPSSALILQRYQSLLGSTWIVQDNVSLSRPLITSAKYFHIR